MEGLCLLSHRLIPDVLGMLFLPSVRIPATPSAPSVAAEWREAAGMSCHERTQLRSGLPGGHWAPCEHPGFGGKLG